MKVLIIGGTQFLGLHTVQAALAAGHAVTTFNRGTRPGLSAQRETELVQRWRTALHER